MTRDEARVVLNAVRDGDRSPSSAEVVDALIATGDLAGAYRMGVSRCACIPPDHNDLAKPWLRECDYHKAQREALAQQSSGITGELTDADLADCGLLSELRGE